MCFLLQKSINEGSNIYDRCKVNQYETEVVLRCLIKVYVYF